MVELKAQRESGKRPAPAGIAKEAKKRKTEAVSFDYFLSSCTASHA